MTDYVRIPIREEEHRRLVALQNIWTGKIDSYVARPSLSDVIRELLDCNAQAQKTEQRQKQKTATA